VDSIDDKIENATEKVLSKLDIFIDKVIDGEIPTKF
jgi:hypothetical protein